MAPTVPFEAACVRGIDGEDKESRRCVTQRSAWRPLNKSYIFPSCPTRIGDATPSLNGGVKRHITPNHRPISGPKQTNGRKRTDDRVENLQDFEGKRCFALTASTTQQRRPPHSYSRQDATPTKRIAGSSSPNEVTTKADVIDSQINRGSPESREHTDSPGSARQLTSHAALTKSTTEYKSSGKGVLLGDRTGIEDETRSTTSQTHVGRFGELAAEDVCQGIDAFDSSLFHGGPGMTDFSHLPDWTWPLLLSRHVKLQLQVECFLKSNNASIPFHLKKAQEALRFYDDFLSDHPVHILRLEHDSRLTPSIVPQNSPLDIRKIVGFSVKPPDEDFIELEMAQRRDGGAVEVMAFLQPSKFKSRRMHEISPYFGLVDRKYVMLTVKLRVLLAPPVSREIDMHHSFYCKIVHSRAKLRFHRLIGMFENQTNHNVYV